MTTKEKTAEILDSMLKANTGTHFLDSGDAYGRNWQQNQEREFETEKHCTLSFRWDCIEVTHNVYHWLLERLEYNEELDDAFSDYQSREDREDKYDIDDMECFAREEREGTGIYGEGEPMVVNTCNNEDLLSQTIQYVYWNDDDGEHILLQIHGGCDVRGGYTRPRAFDLNGMSELAMFDNARAAIYPDVDTLPGKPDDDIATLPGFDGLVESKEEREEKVRDVYWYTDDGCNYYFQGSCGLGAGTQLEEYDIVKFDDEGIEENGDRHIDDVKGTGVIAVDDDGNGYCPITGCLLCASFC
jgi:hypothetical protein